MKYQIIAEDLSFRYSEQDELALKNINLRVEQGEFVAIIGHNGSGKSTLAKHINALLIPISGKIEVMGMDTGDSANLWEIRQRVGMVFQNPDNQLVATIVEEDVAFGPENQGVPTAEIRKRVDDALRAVGLYEYRTHGPHLLSGGQKQRVAIAGVLAMEPDCIVLDEATAMLDPKGRQELLEIIHRLNKVENKTIILITHFMEEATGADRVLVMDRGKIALEGAPAEVFLEAKRLKELGLDIPKPAQLARRLRRDGVKLTHILKEDEMVVELCQLKSQV